jgi:hypothetical protein
MKSSTKRNCRLAGSLLLVTLLSLNGVAQASLAKQKEAVASSDDKWFYIAIFVILTSLGVAYYFWKKSKKVIEDANKGGQYANYHSDNFEFGEMDADKELEWLRKAKKSPKSKSHAVSFALRDPEPPATNGGGRITGGPDGLSVDTRAFQDKMKMLQYAQLPVNSFGSLTPAKRYEELPESNAKSLLDAIDQTNEEFEDDEAAREAAIKVLAAFRTCNSVEALSQMALYDLSSSVRSKAVTVLADFDHESVFESILLACADPTREVRAAAARGLFRLNFDRSGAWKRIIETNDEFRMSQAVRAAIESDIVTKSLYRLVHEDLKIAYEAFTLVALIIRSGENGEIFKALSTHKDERVKFALLHVLKAIKDERSVAGLEGLAQNNSSSSDLRAKTQDVLKSLKGIAARTSA